MLSIQAWTTRKHGVECLGLFETVGVGGALISILVTAQITVAMFQGSTGSGEKVIVAVKQGNLLATAFHPELTADTRWYASMFHSLSYDFT